MQVSLESSTPPRFRRTNGATEAPPADPLPAPLRAPSPPFPPAPRTAARATLGRDRRHDALATRLMARYRDSRSDRDFERLYAHSHREVMTWIRSLLRQGPAHLDAAELLQDTFVNVYRYPRSFRDENDSSFRVWVRTIAGNLVRRARTPSPMQSAEWHEGTPEPTDPGGRPDEVLDLLESVSSLDGALRLFLSVYYLAWLELAPRDRVALELVEARGFSHAHAAERLGVRTSNMKMIVFRARKRLAHRMRTYLGCAGRLPSQRLAG